MWARWAPSAVVLTDGSVLALGDEGGKYEGPPDHSRIAERWEPATGEWRETGSLSTPRAQFAMVALRDGRALVAGGLNAGFVSYSSAYLYDPQNGQWTKSGLMITARAAPAAAVLDDGRVLVAGGAYYTGVEHEGAMTSAALAGYRSSGGDRADSGGILTDTWPGPSGHALATAEIFDPRTGEWSRTGSMRFARASAMAVTLTDGRVLVAGAAGYADVDDRAFDSAEVYDPATGRFSDAGRVGLAGATVDQMFATADGGALACGRVETGFAVFRWDGRTSWAALPGWGSGRSHAVAIALSDGTILSVGGYAAVPPWPRGADLFDLASQAWSKLPSMPGPRAGAAVVVLADGSALVIGGWSDGGDGWPRPLGDVYRFIPATP